MSHDMESARQSEVSYVPGRITTIVPSFNYACYLAETLDSILGQAVHDREVIVVDDCSTDDTPGVVARYGERVRYARQPRQMGSGTAVNRGAQMSTGEFLTFLDADDIWTVTKLPQQLAVLDRRGDIDMVFGHVEEFFSPEMTALERSAMTLRRAPAPVAGTMMIRRSAYLRVGGFAEDVVCGEFIDWYARAVDAGLRSLMLSEVVLRRRLHASNLGRQQRSARPDYVRVLKQSLDRRRAQAPSAGRRDGDL